MNVSELLALLVALCVGVALGASLTGLGRRREDAHEQRRNREVAGAIAPLQQSVERMQDQLRELETARAGAHGALAEQVRATRETSELLRAETAALASALRSPGARGRWGEMQLRRVVEVAGMVAHCDFEVQPTLGGANQPLRPDLVVRLAGGRSIAVDAKVPLTAYLDAETSNGHGRLGLADHARALRAHVDALAAKRYWAALAPSPEFVVMFVPGEAFLAPALEHDPALLEYAMGRRVVIATPTTLVAMLRTVGYAWQQTTLADNARAVIDAAQQLYSRLSTFTGHLDRLGRALGRAVGDYNGAVGSLETRLLPQARRLCELGVEGAATLPEPVTVAPRTVTAGTEADAPP